MWPNGGQSPGELRRFFCTGQELGVRRCADNSEGTAGIRNATEAIDEDENRGGSPAWPPWASVKPRSHMTMMAGPRSNRGLPSCSRTAPPNRRSRIVAKCQSGPSCGGLKRLLKVTREARTPRMRATRAAVAWCRGTEVALAVGGLGGRDRRLPRARFDGVADPLGLPHGKYRGCCVRALGQRVCRRGLQPWLDVRAATASFRRRGRDSGGRSPVLPTHTHGPPGPEDGEGPPRWQPPPVAAPAAADVLAVNRRRRRADNKGTTAPPDASRQPLPSSSSGGPCLESSR